MHELDALHAELERTVRVLEPHINNIRSTRLGEYLRVLRNLRSSDTGHKFDLARDWHKHAAVLFESQELAHASRQLLLPDPPQNIRDVFLKAIRGPVAYPQEREKSIKARNFEVELLVAADFTEVNVQVEVGIEPDLLVHSSAGSLYCACKRPQRASSVRANVLNAFNQIESACTGVNRLAKRGFVAVDITKLINPSFALFMPNRPGGVRVEGEQLIAAFCKTHLQGLPLPLHSLGVVLRLAFTFVDPRTQDLAHTTVVSIHTSAAPGSLKHRTITALANPFRSKTAK